MKPLRTELQQLLNGYSAEKNSNTPDYLLAEFLERCLDAFDSAVRQRDQWYGVHLEPGNTYFERDLTANEIAGCG